MPFTVPNTADAAYSPQAGLDSGDLAMLAAAPAVTGVVSGCAVTAQATANMTVAVGSGVARIGGRKVVVTGGNVTITTANATLPRHDLITVDANGALAAVAGTAAAVTASSEPVFAAIPAAQLPLAVVYVPAGDTAINANQITDKRVIVDDPKVENAAWYGPDATGASSATTALNTFVAAIPDGGTGVVPPGTYLLGSGSKWSLNGKNMRLLCYGARFMLDGTGIIVDCNQSYATTYSVTSAVAGTITNPEGTVQDIITLTTSATITDVAAGDLVKVVADDLLANFPTGHPGEFHHAYSVSGTTLVVTGKFRDTFSTGIRVAKVAPYRLAIQGGTFGHSATAMAAAGSGNSVIMIRNAYMPVLRDVHVENANGPAFMLRSCYAPLIDGCSALNALDDPPNNRFGYGINDDGCSFMRVDRFTARRTRHAFSANGAGTASTNQSLELYGRPYGAVITDGVALETTQMGWDSHNAADSITFHNCLAIDCYGGFNLRGTNHRVVGGTVKGGGRGSGANVFTTTSCDSYGSYIGGGLILDDVSGDQIIVGVHTGGTNAGVQETRPTIIDGVVIRNRATGKYAINATNATVYVNDLYATPTTGTLINRTNSVVQATPQMSLA